MHGYKRLDVTVQRGVVRFHAEFLGFVCISVYTRAHPEIQLLLCIFTNHERSLPRKAKHTGDKSQA